MKQFRMKSTIQLFDSCDEFCQSFKIGEGDLVITSGHIYTDFLKEKIGKATAINMRKYGSGEPNNILVEKMMKDVKEVIYKRVFAIGGGSIIDVAKLFALKKASPVIDLFERKIEIEKDKELIIVPTTCGTGSEVTNISILELKEKNTKFGLAVDEIYADFAVLIPELLETLPFTSFATSSIDAFVHAIESYLSPKANAFTKMYSKEAMALILSGYQTIAQKGEKSRISIMENFILASTYAGIAFGNAGTAAVHALSYPLGSVYHIPHGESNYAMFRTVFNKYMEINPKGEISSLNKFLAMQLDCKEMEVYQEIEKLFAVILPVKSLKSYGVTKEQLEEFTDSVLQNQGRLLANNYVELSRESILEIYTSAYT